MRRIVIAMLLLALVFLSACGTQVSEPIVQAKSLAPAAPAAKQVIKIGASFPLTGDNAFFGVSDKQAMELALEELENTKYEYELIVEDDKLDPKTTATVVTKLAEIDNVDALVTVSSGTGNAAAPLANQFEVIHFGIASDAAVASGKYNFIHWTKPEDEGVLWVKEAKKRGIEDVAVIGLQHPGAQAILDGVRKAAKEEGINLVFDEQVQGGEKDFRTLLLKAKQTNPDIYMLMTFDPELSLLHKQLRELGIETDVSSVEAFDLTDDQEQFEGMWFVNAAEASNKFTKAYEAKFGDEPKIGAPNAYDVVNMLVHAFESAGDGKTKPSTDAVIAELEKIKDFDGALGSLTMGPDSIISSPPSVRLIKDGKSVTLN